MVRQGLPKYNLRYAGIFVGPSRVICVPTVHIFNAIRPWTRHFAGVERWIFRENYITESLNETRLGIAFEIYWLRRNLDEKGIWRTR